MLWTITTNYRVSRFTEAHHSTETLDRRRDLFSAVTNRLMKSYEMAWAISTAMETTKRRRRNPRIGHCSSPNMPVHIHVGLHNSTWTTQYHDYTTAIVDYIINTPASLITTRIVIVCSLYYTIIDDALFALKLGVHKQYVFAIKHKGLLFEGKPYSAWCVFSEELRSEQCLDV